MEPPDGNQKGARKNYDSRHPDLSYEVGLLQGEYLLTIAAEEHEPVQRTVESTAANGSD